VPCRHIHFNISIVDFVLFKISSKLLHNKKFFFDIIMFSDIATDSGGDHTPLLNATNTRTSNDPSAASSKSSHNNNSTKSSSYAYLKTVCLFSFVGAAFLAIHNKTYIDNNHDSGNTAPVFSHKVRARLGSFETGYDLDQNEFDGDVWHVPFEFYRGTKWADAKFWHPGSNQELDGDVSELTDEQRNRADEQKFMPVFKSKGVDGADVVITAHATNLKSNGWVILDSAKKNGLEIVISGNGTTFHGFADKMMGLKAALHSIPGNPLVINADATDVLMQCGPEEFRHRFEQAEADFIFGGETQLWPEVVKYFSMTPETDFKKEMSLTFGDIGKAAGDSIVLTGEHPNVWANAGSFMGRKNDLINYIQETENRMLRHNDYKAEDGFGYTCKPAGTADGDFSAEYPNMRQFDDQECLTAFEMQKLLERNTRHKLDADGSILFSAGGAPMDRLARDDNGMVYYKETGKASCLWHFNNPSAKIRLKDFANAFPDKFLTEAGRNAMIRTPDEHPGNRNGQIGPAPSESS
jgi:hypothetical protein